MFYFGLFVLLIALLTFAYLKQGLDISAPATLFLAGMTVAVLLAWVGLFYWNTEDLDLTVFLITAFGVLGFLIGAASTTRICVFENRKTYCNSSFKIDSLRWVYVLGATVIVAALVLRILESFKMAIEMGIDTSNFQTMMKGVRNATATFFSADAYKLDFGYSIPSRILSKAATAVPYAVLPILAYKLTNRDNRIIWPLVIVALSILSTLATGGRGGLFMMLLSFAIAVFFFGFKQANDKKKFSLTFVILAAGLAVIAAVGFYFMGALVGRKASTGILDYLSFYFGGGLPSFQLLLSDTIDKALYLGGYTFFNVYSALYKFGLIDTLTSYSIAWVDVGYSSNIFGPFARFYLDFGITGVIVFSFATGCILTLLYKKAQASFSPVWIAIYCYIAPYIFDMAREEFLFSRMISIDKIITLILIACFTYILTCDFAQLKARKKTE